MNTESYLTALSILAFLVSLWLFLSGQFARPDGPPWETVMEVLNDPRYWAFSFLTFFLAYRITGGA